MTPEERVLLAVFPSRQLLRRPTGKVAQLERRMQRILDSLSERERMVLRLMRQRTGKPAPTFAKVAKVLSITADEVRTAHATGLAKLQAPVVPQRKPRHRKWRLIGGKP
ncbi:MAG: sigma factor-like helix-turn-helix DNA-binding protein [Patescibacteria group bacterium]|nr:sigma factor-like helix-turn-helix DNA-binding protein [Patescibacteria group bacterium]